MTSQVFFGLLIAAIFLFGFMAMQKSKNNQEAGTSLHYQQIEYEKIS